jgi:preprotein translocase subunit YajC
MLISTAYAQAAAPAAGGAAAGFESFLPLVLIFIIFYFLLIRPQQKRMKTHKDMLEALRRGDRVVTGGGIIGTVTHIADGEITVEIADNVKVKVMRPSIAEVLSKTEPVGGKAANDPKPAEEGKSGSLLGKLLGGNDEKK